MNNKERVMDILLTKSIEPVSREKMMNDYSISDEELEKYRKDNLNSVERRNYDVKVSELSKREANQLKSAIKAYAEDSNRKLKRVIYQNYEEDKDYVDMVTAKVYDLLPEVYKNTGKGLRVNENIIDRAVKGEIGLESRMMGKNSYRSKQTLYKSLEIDLDKIDIDSLTKYEATKIRSELFSLKDPASLRKKNIGDKAILKRDEMEYRDKIKDIHAMEEEWMSKVKSSKLKGEIPVTFRKGLYDIEEGAGDFEKYSKYKESIDKKAVEGYREWRINIVKENYIEAAYKSMPLGAAAELENIVRQIKPHDFEMLIKSTRIGEIYFVYAVGSIDYEIILSGLREALSKVKE